VRIAAPRLIVAVNSVPNVTVETAQVLESNMTHQMRKYVVAERNGYYCVDEYKKEGDKWSNTRTVASGLKKKQAEMIAGELFTAIYYFMQDNSLTDKGYGELKRLENESCL
jgi:hypothetical protein